MAPPPVPASAVALELVADAAHGDDQLRALGIALDLLTEVGDVDVAGALVAVELGLPELLHDLAAGEDLAGAADEQAQQLELRAGEADRLATHGGDVADEVDRDRAGF